jgi:hypothetical protein
MAKSCGISAGPGRTLLARLDSARDENRNHRVHIYETVGCVKCFVAHNGAHSKPSAISLSWKGFAIVNLRLAANRPV